MLKYEIKLTDDNFKQDILVWHEKYLAPDLSFVSGVTSQAYHLEKFDSLPLTNTLIDNMNASANLETENVTRQGYVIIRNKPYEVNSGSVVDYSVDSSGTVITYDYLFLNGKYYYAVDEEDKKMFYIDSWVTEEEKDYEDGTSGMTIVEKSIEVEYSGDGFVYIDTIAWIEDGMVTIDGNEYFFDREEEIDSATTGCIKYYEDGVCLDYSAITECDGIDYYPFPSTDKYLHVTKFKLTKQEELHEEFDKITFCKHFFYVRYKDHYLPIRLSDTEFKCDIPNYVLGTVDDEKNPLYYETVEYDLYYIDEVNNASADTQVTGETFDDLLLYKAYVIIEDDVFFVENDIMNANDGKDIAVYLNLDVANVAIGDRFKFIDSSEDSHLEYVYTVDKYGFSSDDTEFILFSGKKYKVEPNICDKAIINGNEYSINYINGKITDKDCLVLIGEEEVPMLISSETDGEYSAGTLTRYGKIITKTSRSAVTVSYDIKPYSGITVDNKKYIIKEESDESGNTSYYAYLDRSNEYSFVVNEIIGSSMVVCRPDINITDFTDDFNDFISREICKDVVDNQMDMLLFLKNKIFGDKEITQELAFQAYVNPTSSDDYYNLFENLEIYTRNGYIHIPLALSNLQGNNIIQDDIVESQFFEEVKKRAINPIVDMEKDVYAPKFIRDNEKYSGSDTDFDPIIQVKVNLHFRTRDLTSWKVNEGYNNIVSSGNNNTGATDNWFITDYHPYVDMIGDNTNADKLLETSDLLGLLDFTNDDVYYQKSKVAKSFLRFSIYDSTDPQTQSLLSTSCIFMDEHKLFKRFIDNSRKNISDFGYVAEPEFKMNDDGTYDLTTDIAIGNGKVTNKIDVSTEYLGTRQETKGMYIDRNNQYHNEFKGVILSNDNRIGSDFIIDNKYKTDTSSEGFYFYIFREYSENLMPKPLYMKVEFNHAGIGKTIPFIIPMKWTEPNSNGDKFPDNRLTLRSTDLPTLKEGIKLADVYAQTYIPLYAVYDFKNKEYAYVFDTRYVGDITDNTVTLNLFELKVKNEEFTTETEEEIEELQRDITLKTQERAVINVNDGQFPTHDKECDE